MRIGLQDLRALLKTYLTGYMSREGLRGLIDLLADDPRTYPYTTELNFIKAVKIRLDEHARLVGYTEVALINDLVELLEKPVEYWVPGFKP
jgi:hypothetical protein